LRIFNCTGLKVRYFLEMELKQSVSKEAFEELCRKAGSSFKAAVELWEIGMKTLPIGKRDYGRVCRAGRHAQEVKCALVAEAERRGYTDEEIDKLLGLEKRVGISFN